MAKRRVSVLILDEHNLAEMARRGVSAADVVQVIANRHITAPNPRGEEGSMLLIGETDGGRVLTVPLAPRSRRLPPHRHLGPAPGVVDHRAGWERHAHRLLRDAIVPGCRG